MCWFGAGYDHTGSNFTTQEGREEAFALTVKAAVAEEVRAREPAPPPAGNELLKLTLEVINACTARTRATRTISSSGTSRGGS